MQDTMTPEDASEKYNELYNFWQNLPNGAPPSQEELDMRIEQFTTVES